MNSIARQCSEKPVTWREDWATAWKLETPVGRSRFVFKQLEKLWARGNGFAIPANASPELASAFTFGKDFVNPDAPLDTHNGEQFIAMMGGFHERLLELHALGEAEEDYKTLAGPACTSLWVNVKLYAAGIQVDLNQHGEACKVLMDAILAWNDPGALLRSFSTADARNRLRDALQQITANLNGPDAMLAKRVSPQHVQAFNRLVRYIDINTRQERRKK